MELAAIVIVLWSAMTVAPETLVLTVLLGWTLLALAVMDARSLFLSDALTLPLIPLGLVVITALDPGGIWDSIAGVVVGAAMMSALAWAYLRYRHREGLGLGDVKLAAAAGAWVGLQGLGTVILWAVMVNAAMLAIVALKGERLTADTPVPLGTGLAAGLWLTWLYGPVSIA
jgi:leader peptidase (prepilin peptidase)/N-methyltransferase